MWLLHALLTRLIRRGHLEVTDAAGRIRHYGDDSGRDEAQSVAIAFMDRLTPWRIILNPALGFGEAWMDGRMAVMRNDIAGFLDLIGVNTHWDDDDAVRLGLWRPVRRSFWWGAINWEYRSRRNVRHHYDLSAELYDAFLGVDRQYSCGYFPDLNLSLDAAQHAKLAHIAAKLDLRAGQHVLDIGCGWGGLALYLNRVFGVEVTGITLSDEQLTIARDRAERAGVTGQVRFELIDYRRVTGKFDRIVSVGMFEHVGPRHYRRFFAKCRHLLCDDGVMLLHTIGRADGPAPTDPWLARYIFPGGHVPALSEIAPAVERARLWITDVETLRLHYAHTIERWAERVDAQAARIAALYDDRFLRMWQFYLAGALVAFRHDAHVNFQVQLTRRREALPITRDYMAAAEARASSDRDQSDPRKDA